MKEQFEALLGLARSAWRFRWIALAVAWFVAIGGTLAVLALPNKYESKAQIYVDTRSVLRPLLQGLAVSPETQDQTDVVRRALLARPSLEQVAQTVGLYKRTASAAGAESLVTELAQLISIDGNPAVGLYSISYSDGNPKVAQAVVQTLLDTFKEKSLGAGRTDTQSAEKFLQQQVTTLEERLSKSEDALAEFKKRNVGLMPDERGDYFRRMQAEVATQERIRTDLAVATTQRDALRSKLSGEQRGTVALANMPSSQDIQAATTLDTRIRDSKRQLEELLLKFTDRHPEVLALKDQIARLEEQRRVDLGGVRATNGSRSEGSSVSIDPVMQNLQIQLNSADVQVAALQTQASQAGGRVAELRRVVTAGPEVEAELVRLNRDYGVTKQQYEALLGRLANARLSNEADRSEDGRFKLMEPPRAPLRPIKPNRLLLLIGTLFAALGTGLGLALLLALTRPVVYSKRVLANLTGLPVIGVVSRSRTPRRQAAERRDRFLCAAAAAILVVAVVGTGMFSYPAAKLFRHAAGLEVS